MKEPVLYDPETDTLLVEIRPWPASARPELVAGALNALRAAKGFVAD